MSIVSWMVGTADGFLADAAESQFGAVASNTGTIVPKGDQYAWVPERWSWGS
jgi:hypothetical protein